MDAQTTLVIGGLVIGAVISALVAVVVDLFKRVRDLEKQHAVSEEKLKSVAEDVHDVMVTFWK